jgi:hypothetical protein
MSFGSAWGIFTTLGQGVEIDVFNVMVFVSS